MMDWTGVLCATAGAVVITFYTVTNFRLRKKGREAVWWGGWALGSLGMILTGVGWGLLALAGPHYDVFGLRITGLVLSAGAGVLYFAGAAHVGRLRSKKSFTLVLNTRGVYRFVRHPQALALCMLAAGVGLTSLSVPYLIALPVLAGYWIVYTYLEEHFELLPAYGEQYRRYTLSTGRLLPNWRDLGRLVPRRPEGYAPRRRSLDTQT
jgi:protein-S-isoprenylcysteine O-methyltransferase Ste14